MKFTDGFFTFPIKIYDGASLRRVMEAAELMGSEEEPDWVSGTFRMPAEQINDMAWWDGFSRGRTAQDVRESGFDVTVIFSPDQGELTCTWPRKKFEDKINEFVEKMGRIFKEENLNL